MKLVMCTLAVCLSVLASTFTVREAVKVEARRTRGAVGKAAAPEDTAGAEGAALAAVGQRLEALTRQLEVLNGRVSAVEAAVGALPVPEKVDMTGVETALAKLDGVPGALAELAEAMGEAFEEVEAAVRHNERHDEVAESLEALEAGLAVVDSYFTPLYRFLGTVYDPQAVEAAQYPSLDVRVNALQESVDKTRQEISELKEWVTHRVIEPVKRPR